MLLGLHLRRMRIYLEIARTRSRAHGRERILAWILRSEWVVGAGWIAECILLRYMDHCLRGIGISILRIGCYDAGRVATMAGRRANVPVAWVRRRHLGWVGCAMVAVWIVVMRRHGARRLVGWDASRFVVMSATAVVVSAGRMSSSGPFFCLFVDQFLLSCDSARRMSPCGCRSRFASVATPRRRLS